MRAQVSGELARGAANDLVKAIDDATTGFSTASVGQAGGPYKAGIGEQIAFTGSGSFDPDGSITKYAWDFNNDGKIDESSDSLIAIHTYAKPYKGLVALTVTGNDGRQNTATADVTVDAAQHAPARPSAPRDVSARQAGPSQVLLTWRDPASIGDAPVSGYRVRRGDGMQVSVVGADARSLTIDGVPVDTEVGFTVLAVNEFGNSKVAESNTVRLASASTSGSETASSAGFERTTEVPLSGAVPDRDRGWMTAGIWILGALAIALVAIGAWLIIRRLRRSSHGPS